MSDLKSRRVQTERAKHAQKGESLERVGVDSLEALKTIGELARTVSAGQHVEDCWRSIGQAKERARNAASQKRSARSCDPIARPTLGSAALFSVVAASSEARGALLSNWKPFLMALKGGDRERNARRREGLAVDQWLVRASSPVPQAANSQRQADGVRQEADEERGGDLRQDRRNMAGGGGVVCSAIETARGAEG